MGRPDLGRPIRVVLFCGPFLERAAVRFVAALESHPEVEFLRGFCQGPAQRPVDRLRDLWRRRGPLAVPIAAVGAGGALARFALHPRRESAYRTLEARVAARIDVVPDLHADAVLARVRDLAPDLGLIYGGPILMPEIFRTPTLGTLGIHHGKVPEYRGKKTTFWAMYNGDASVGVTIQHVNEGIDTGAIVRAGEVPVAGRSYPAVWRELERLGLRLYLDAVLAVKRGQVVFRPQEGVRGRLYRDPHAADLIRFHARRLLAPWRRRRAAAPESREVSGDTRPRICLLLETYYPVVGGGETQARLLARALVRRGHDVVLITRRSGKELRAAEIMDGVRVYRIPPSGAGHLKKWGMAIWATAALFRLRRSYDVIFVAGFRVLGLPAVLIGGLLGKPRVLKAESDGEASGEFFTPGLRRLGLDPAARPVRAALTLRNRGLGRADGFVAISRDIAREIAAAGVPAGRIHMIPNGVDTDRFRTLGPDARARLRRRLGIAPEERIVLFTGRLVSYKGLPLLLEVWREFHRNHPGTRLFLVGSGGLDIHNCEEELRRYVAANGLAGSVVFTGAVKHVHVYLQAADIFVFPTEREAFGLSLVEAMACGLPAVTTPTGGVRDIVTAGEDALVVEAGDFRSHYAALDALLTDRALADRLGRAAAKTVARRFARDPVVDRYVALFRSVAATRTAGAARAAESGSVAALAAPGHATRKERDA